MVFASVSAYSLLFELLSPLASVIDSNLEEVTDSFLSKKVFLRMFITTIGSKPGQCWVETLIIDLLCCFQSWRKSFWHSLIHPSVDCVLFTQIFPCLLTIFLCLIYYFFKSQRAIELYFRSVCMGHVCSVWLQPPPSLLLSFSTANFIFQGAV